jgi:predicted alpha/beta-hydrolase family hydrolase
MRNTTVLASLALLALAAAFALGHDETAPAPAPAEADIATPRGVALKATVHKPAKGNGAAIVLAPGQGYHRGLPLMAKGAQALADAGFVAIRYDWAYFTAKGQPSADLAAEVADLDAAVAFARKQEGVTRVLVAGKSLGSAATVRWGAAHKDDVAGFALLTPPLSDPDDPSGTDPRMAGFEKLGDGTLIVVGDNDDLCDLATLYRALQMAGSRQRVVIVPGDHGFVEGDKASPETEENVDLVVRNLVVWAKRRVAK